MVKAVPASHCTMCHYSRLEDGKQRKVVAQEQEAVVGVKARYTSEILTRRQFVTGCPAGYVLTQGQHGGPFQILPSARLHWPSFPLLAQIQKPQKCNH